ncbi:MAG TPA: hypothetical protein VM582_07215 [Candidatus Thermoplasmatota archaeon]|nr:hypothetical protein [Candidatus Thermoplasmatota archaeon]
MDLLDCRSPRACPTCEHWVGAACRLEEQIALALAPRAPPIAVVLARPAVAAT